MYRTWPNVSFSNGDAHLKNFSLLETSKGDYKLSPAYDLIDSRIHVDDSDFAFNRGLFADNFKSATFKKNNHACKADFAEFGKRIGMRENRMERIIQLFIEKQKMVETLVSRSFLDDGSKRRYLLHYNTRRNFLIA